MRSRYHYRTRSFPEPYAPAPYDYDYWYRRHAPHPRRRPRRAHRRAHHPRTWYDDYLAFDAGEPRPRRYGQRWRHYLDELGRLKERARQRWRESEESTEDVVGRGRRFARRYREPIVGAALAGATLPIAGGIAGGEQPTTEEGERTTSEQRLLGHPVSRRSLEEDVGRRMASMRAEDIREATIEGATVVYGISRNLAELIHDTAVANGIEPELAFGLVKTESAFDDRAVSSVGARGLTQVMPRTARWLRPGTTIEDLYNRRLNLNLGFGYLRDLIDKYKGDVRLALLAYNRGPGTVDRVLARGGDPDNGYADKVLEGYTDLS